MIVKNIKVPTGNICVIKGDKGLIEFLSIGDYGKDSNIKADFLGITRELNGVPNGEIMPLSEKWVITISTQYGCSMGCKFCDVPKVGKGLNATLNDLTNQLVEGLKLHKEIESTKRLNLHYARMGEPTFNFDVIEHSKQLHKIVKPYIGNSMIHPVISTMLPKANKRLMEFLNEWCDIKNYTYRGDAGLQFSINSTDDSQRNEMFSGNSLSLNDISKIGRMLPDPKGRKYALNFALADNYIVDAEKLAMLFNPTKFMVKITPLHKTQSCDDNGIITTDGYEAFTPYQKAETDLKNAGFDVIVFVPSYDEDLGLITCGNAILSGSIPKTNFIQIL
ncbi:MAG: Fe-S-oxidoreductase [Uliginosibacterium sp.]|nr:Fe-S-oxidoreductase [Uliginosibacterium sp.]